MTQPAAQRFLAPPIDKLPDDIRKATRGLFSGVHIFVSGQDTEWFQPVRPGGTFDYTAIAPVGLTVMDPNFRNPRSYNWNFQLQYQIAHDWVASSAPCTPPQPNTWNHLVWEFERDSAGHVIFTAVTLNGNRETPNLSMPHVGDSSTGLDVAFQPDANLDATPYSVWLDNITLTYW